MLKIYCSDCGTPTNYTSNKPKFCTGCGNPFDKNINQNKVIAKNPAPINIQKPKIQLIDQDDDDYGDESEVNHVPNIRGLDCEIAESYKSGEKIGNIVGTSEGSSRSRDISNKKNNKPSKLERKKFLEDFSKEAGALKPKTRIRKNGK